MHSDRPPQGAPDIAALIEDVIGAKAAGQKRKRRA
jgi:hypothetical protein